MKSFILKLLGDLLLLILRLLDNIVEMFRILSGIEKINTKNGDAVGLVEYFLEADYVIQVFWSIFLLSVVLVGICIIAAVIKHTVNLRGGERKPHIRTVGQGIGSIPLTLVFLFLMLSGIGIANSMLGYVDSSFNNNNIQTLGLTVFDMAVEEGFEVDWDTMLNNEAYHIIDDGVVIGYIYEYKKDANDNYIITRGYCNGYTINDIYLKAPEGGQADNADSIFGVYKTSLNLPTDDMSKSERDKRKVDIEKFNFLVAYAGAVSLLVVISISLLGLVKRLYDLVILFLALPLTMATIPLDDGARFKAWRETVISKVVLAYGTVFSVNVFIIIMGLLSELAFDSLGPVGVVLKLFIIVGGALSISGGQLLFARLLGTSAEESRDMMQSFRTAMAGGAAAVGAGSLASSAVFGQKDGLGGQRRGGIAAVAKGVANVSGKALLGNNYERAVNYTKSKASGLESALRGRFMESGGIVGGMKKVSKYAAFSHAQNAVHPDMPDFNISKNNQLGSSLRSSRDDKNSLKKGDN